MTRPMTVKFAMFGTVDDDWLFSDNFDEEVDTGGVGDGWEDSIHVNSLVRNFRSFGQDCERL